MPFFKGRKRLPFVASLIETFGFSPWLASLVALGMMIACALAVLWVIQSAPPRRLVMTGGPEGSSFQRWAAAYQKKLARHGVTLTVEASAGSRDNLLRLRSETEPVDVGFVTGGIGKGENLGGLVSLGSVAYQPLWIFYRATETYSRLSQFAGRRLWVGAQGSGTHELAVELLKANGITGEPTVFSDLDADAAADALLQGRLDAVFLMGDSASLQTLRKLVHSPDVRIFSFSQADAYLRRYTYLNRITLPEGSIDLGKNLPARDIVLIGPTVELVAREGLHSALSDLLIEVAQSVHGDANLLQKRGEFPAPLEHEFRLSDDAARYYKSGKSFLYKAVGSFWVASLLNRALVAVVPLVLVLVPAIRMLPVAFRMRVQLRLYRCYRPLLRIERETFKPLTAGRVDELLAELDRIEADVNQLKVPASFAASYYWLQSHVSLVRARLKAAGGAA